jgi:hypothetical protein
MQAAKRAFIKNIIKNMKKIKTNLKEAKGFKLALLFPKTYFVAGTPIAVTFCNEVEAPKLEKILTDIFVEFMVQDCDVHGEKFKLYSYEKW